MTRWRVIAGIVILMLAAACGPPMPGAHGGQDEAANVTGVLDQGPAPTCPADEACDPVIRASTVIFVAGGAEFPAAVHPDGSFRLHLGPGRYSITAPSPFADRIVPSSVIVPATGSVFLRLQLARPLQTRVVLRMRLSSRLTTRVSGTVATM